MSVEDTTGVAIVTGASRGIGRGVAEHLHAAGYALLTASRQDIEDQGDEWTHVVADLGTSEGLDALLNHELASRATVLVNNVGQIRAVGGVSAELPADARATFETNFFGPLECCRRLADTLRANQGTIVNIASIYGSVSPAPAVLSYATSKAALNALTQSLALELAPDVRVNAILPGNIDTSMTRGAGDEYVAEVVGRTPLGRLGTTEEVAQAVDFLVNAPFVTGHLLTIDGGISLIGG